MPIDQSLDEDQMEKRVASIQERDVPIEVTPADELPAEQGGQYCEREGNKRIPTIDLDLRQTDA
ncbi:hypothetical protein [Variovorax sp. HW608]|uniref:hypothetical protein n=1 Tax=Variovorax sp. HW608 TaxID=1034889 RepID=UPI0012FE4591|nr:hypothetical protein [Variovorax sp. HW608]